MRSERLVGLCIGWMVLALVGCATEPPAADDAADTQAESALQSRTEAATPEASLIPCMCTIEPIMAGPEAESQLGQLPEICQQICGVCGDGFCEGNEPFNCPFDCGSPSFCGDFVCDLGEQFSCPQDCGPTSFCGDLVCDVGEQLSCPVDCGPAPVCGNLLCETNEASACPSDCVPPPVACGVGACKDAFSVTSAQAQARMAWAQRCAANPAPGASGAPRPGTQYLTAQSVSTYAAANLVLQRYQFPVYFDFVTGGAWGAPDASGTSCAVQPTSAINSALCVAGCVPSVVCGNGLCEAGETTLSCPADCGPPPPVCGDGLCQFPEDSSTCSFDCGPVCGDGICDLDEVCRLDCGIECRRPPCQIEVPF